MTTPTLAEAVDAARAILGDPDDTQQIGVETRLALARLIEVGERVQSTEAPIAPHEDYGREKADIAEYYQRAALAWARGER